MWKGLKKYMEDFSMLDKREIPEIVIWEQFLVYATAFGIADKVIKQLKAVYKELGRSFEFDDPSYGYMYFMTNNNFTSSFYKFDEFSIYISLCIKLLIIILFRIWRRRWLLWWRRRRPVAGGGGGGR